MGLSDRGKAETVERWSLLRAARKPIHLVVTLDVYDREGKGTKHVEHRQLHDLIIHPKTGERRWRSAKNAVLYDEVADECATSTIALTCHVAQLPAIESRAQIRGLMGGQRAGKSELMAILLILWWVERGRVEKINGSEPGLYWWVGPTLEKAFRVGVKKLARILPDELRGRLPGSAKANDLAITLFDGCRFEFHHANGDGDNLKGEGIQAAAADEITSWNDPANWTILLGRTLDTGAPIAIGSTPKNGHWSREAIILRSREVEAVEQWEVTQFQNPWIGTDEVWRNLQTSGALSATQVHDIMAAHPGLLERAAAAQELIKDPLTLREVFGVWASDGLVLYNDFTMDHVVESEACPPGMQWITDQLLIDEWTSFEGSDRTKVGGQDWNVNPMTTVVARGFGVPSDRSTWGLLVIDEVQTQGDVQTHGLNLQRSHPGIAISCDSHGALPGTPASHGATGSTTNAMILTECGFDVRPCGYKRSSRGHAFPHNPGQVDSVNLTNRLFRLKRLLIHRRCAQLRIGLQTAQRASDGSIYKKSNTKLDRLSAAPDALRYLAWKLFSEDFEGKDETTRWRTTG